MSEHDVRVLVVDDEQAARRRLAIMLEELDVEVVGEAENGVRALEMVAERRPDIVLLDISMPEVDGFDVARHLGPNKPLIIFQTAHDEYALKAFDHAALDYLVKPVTLDRLQKSLARARERLIDLERPQLTDDLIHRIQQTVQGSAVRSPRLLVRHLGGHRLIPYDDVLMFSAKDGVIHARTNTTRFLTDYTLAELERRTDTSFLRPNRADLVNVNHITSITSNGDGSATLVLSDGSEVRVTRRRAAAIRDQLKG